MLRKNKINLMLSAVIFAALSTSVMSTSVSAKTLTLNSDVSQINFVSLKNDAIAEVQNLPELSGTVSDTGRIELSVDLNALDSGIEIRDQRMKKLLFEVAKFPVAQINSQIDPEILNNLKAGESKRETLTLDINIHGKQKLLPAYLQLVKRANGSIMVNTIQPLILNGKDFDLTTGLETLREMANLDSISFSVPVTAQLVFEEPEE